MLLSVNSDSFTAISKQSAVPSTRAGLDLWPPNPSQSASPPGPTYRIPGIGHRTACFHLKVGCVGLGTSPCCLVFLHATPLRQRGTFHTFASGPHHSPGCSGKSVTAAHFTDGVRSDPSDLKCLIFSSTPLLILILSSVY